jgi:mRNA interferase MazF
VTRGEIYTATARAAYGGKPRPVLIVQDDRFDATASVTVCPFTTSPVDAPLIRIPVEPTDTNGLDRPSSLMIDKITTSRDQVWARDSVVSAMTNSCSSTDR